jgi:hypothetical protein
MHHYLLVQTLISECYGRHPLFKTAIFGNQAEILALNYMSFIFGLNFIKSIEWLKKAQFRNLNGVVLVQ